MSHHASPVRVSREGPRPKPAGTVGYGAPVARLGRITTVLAMTLAAAACGGGGGSDVGSGTTATTAATTTVPSTVPGTTVPPTALMLRITDARLVSSEEADNGMRILLPAGVATAAVTLTGLPSPNRVVSVCQARELDSRMPGAACRMPANGEAVTMTLGLAATGVEIVQIGASGTGPRSVGR